MAKVYYVDNGDGTGGNATIVESNPGDSHTFMTSRYAGGENNEAFQVSGSLVGDGGISVSLSPGPYHGFLLTEPSGGGYELSPPIGFRVFNQAENALHLRCAHAIRDYALGLSLPGVTTDPDQHIVVKLGANLQKVLRDADPKEAVYYIPSAESISGADNEFNSFSLPVVVVLLKESGQKLADGLDDVMWWREFMNRNFAKCGNFGLTEIHSTKVTPGVVIDPGRWLKNFDTSVTQISCQAEQLVGVV